MSVLTVVEPHTPDFELVFAFDFPEILRQRARVALSLRHEGDPLVLGFVFEADLLSLRALRCEC